MSNLSDAVDFICSRTLDPVFKNTASSDKLRYQTDHTRKVLKSFRRIGDLVTYFKRFEPTDEESETMKSVREIGIPAFEDIYDEFVSRYEHFENDRTRLTDFVVGQSYTTWDLVNFAGLYNTQGGGILLIGPDEARTAIFVRATLDGSGDYPNEWIEPGVVLKYFMMGMKHGDTKKVFKPSYKVNKAIIESGNVPIYVFDKRGTKNTLVGTFRYNTYIEEGDGSKWFRLVKRDTFESESTATTNELQRELDAKVDWARSESPETRRKRLQTARKKPRSKESVSIVFERNPDVIAEVLDRANGTCERCESPAPFTRKKDNTPYLEVHHKITLADGGDDTVENALALCPNCHRELHSGINPTI